MPEYPEYHQEPAKDRQAQHPAGEQDGQYSRDEDQQEPVCPAEDSAIEPARSHRLRLGTEV